MIEDWEDLARHLRSAPMPIKSVFTFGALALFVKAALSLFQFSNKPYMLLLTLSGIGAICAVIVIAFYFLYIRSAQRPETTPKNQALKAAAIASGGLLLVTLLSWPRRPIDTAPDFERVVSELESAVSELESTSSELERVSSDLLRTFGNSYGKSDLTERTKVVEIFEKDPIDDGISMLPHALEKEPDDALKARIIRLFEEKTSQSLGIDYSKAISNKDTARAAAAMREYKPRNN